MTSSLDEQEACVTKKVGAAQEGRALAPRSCAEFMNAPCLTFGLDRSKSEG